MTGHVTEPVVHSSFTIERDYPHAPEKVFKAFSDITKKRRWFAEGEGFIVDSYDMDFRVGGLETASFRTEKANGPIPAGTVFKNYAVYMDIVPHKRIVSAYNMSKGDDRFSVSLATVQFEKTPKGVHVTFTEQGAFFEGADGAEMRKMGWEGLVDSLGRELNQHA